MTVYEQIEKSIEFIENNLKMSIHIREVAKESGMSLRTFQNYFWMITGYNFKEYLIKRRLSESLNLLKSNRTILDIAIEFGYSSNESYTRAFKKEFNISPKELRVSKLPLKSLKRIRIYKELNMGVVFRRLNSMKGRIFDAYGKNPEENCKNIMEKWIKDNPQIINYRIFGHNIDINGNLCSEDHKGYRFILVTNSEDTVIESGNFIVTGIEGNFKDDPAGKWITAGWKKLSNMVKDKGYKVKDGARWYEEELTPIVKGNLRLDLYLEVE